MVYGESPSELIQSVKKQETVLPSKYSKADDIIESTGVRDGYSIVYGADDVQLLKSLVSNT